MTRPQLYSTRSQPAPILSAGSVVLLLGHMLLAISGCGWEQAPAPVPRANLVLPTLTIVATGDTGGRLTATSCGVARPGGVEHRAALLESLPAGSNPVVLDAGGAALGDLPADRVTWEYLLRAEQALGTAAHNLGREELALAPDSLAKLASETQIPWVSSNTKTALQKANQAKPNDCYLTEPLRVVERGSATVVILGVVSPRAAKEGLVIEEPAKAVRTVLADYGWAQKRPAALVVLADLDADEIEPLAASLPPQTLLINRGPLLDSKHDRWNRASQPHVAVAQTPAAGEGAVVAELNLNEVSPTDQPAPWIVTTPLLDAGGKHPEFTPLLAAYQRELAQGDFTAHDTTWAARRGLLPPPLKELMAARLGALAYAGSQHCRMCHANISMQCDSAPHSAAWQALVDRGQQHEARCQRCHTTGFNSGDQPGLARGFVSARMTPQFAGVSCEACHGPSAAHTLDPLIPTPWTAKQSCVQCHDAEHSPGFAIEAEWQRIQHPRQSAGGEAGLESLGSKL